MEEKSIKNKKEDQTTSNSQAKLVKVQKKPRKRVKGQKDIRALIKSKKNELVSYAKDFKAICKQSGIDVDPEQLQLAIALSKSLQDSHQLNIGTENDKTLTAKQRKGKIRSTLQEYGFKVPDVKTNTNKVKRYRKQYRLLLASDTEKQQIIADKYAQILLSHVSICMKGNESLIAIEETNSWLYNLTTNVSYECLKNNEVFYVNNLMEKHLTGTYHMLKDWSEIPGRPMSPKLEPSDVSFNDIECTQEELNIILSGVIEKAQDIVKTKYKYNKQYTTEENNIANNLDYKDLVSEIETDSKLRQFQNSTDTQESQSKFKMDEDCIIDDTTNASNNKVSYNKTHATNRSYSPDIFDDEVTIIIDSPRVTRDEIPERTLVREQNNFMDLTECVGLANHNKTNFIHNSNLSQGNKTRMNANDVMDLTDCVPAFSNRILDMKQMISDEKENIPNIFEQNSQPETMDLTQCNNINKSNNKLSIEHTSYCAAEDSIIIIEEEDNRCPSNFVKTTIQENKSNNLKNGKEVINNKNENDTVINVEQKYENNDTTARNSDSENDHNLYRLSNESSKDISTSNNILIKNNSTNDLTDNNLQQGDTVLDAMDIIQSSNSEDSLLLMDECRNNATVDAVIDLSQEYDFDDKKNHTVKELIDNDASSSKYSNDSYNISHIVMKDTKNGKNFDSPIKYFSKRSSNSDHSDSENKDNFTKKRKLDVMNLTQSSNFQDDLQIIHETSTANKSLEDTIILNDDEYNLNNVYTNDHRSDVNFVNMEVNDNDREFDNVLENSNVRHSHVDTKLHDTNEFMTSKSIYNDNSYIFENDPDIQNLQFDAIQQNNIEHRYNAKKSLCEDQTIVDINNDVIFDNLLENVSKSKECFKLSKSYADENDGNVDFKNDTFQNNSDTPSCEIDLTQHDFSSDQISAQDADNDYVDRKNNTSLEYEEMKESDDTKDSHEIILERSSDFTCIKSVKKGSGDNVSNSSQISEVFEISDNEFNYSIHQNKHEIVRLDRTKFDIGGISIIDKILNRSSISSTLRCSCAPDSELNVNENKDVNCLPEITFKSDDLLRDDSKTRSDMNYEKVSTPSKCRTEGVLSAITPNHDYIIKTDHVTPMPCYDRMTSPERNQELDKYGIKPLKRKRAIQILTHIYNQTHPVMELMSQSEDCPSPLKIRKMNDPKTFPRRAISTQIDTIMTSMKDSSTNKEPFELTDSSQKSRVNEKLQKSPKKSSESLKDSDKENLYEETKYLPDIRNIECCPEDWIFQTREKSKVHSCRVPLHIAFHNYISCRQALREALLRYEPINIDDIHKGLVDVGYRYNPKDLLKFMDKKCITVKTADNAKSNRK